MRVICKMQTASVRRDGIRVTDTCFGLSGLALNVAIRTPENDK